MEITLLNFRKPGEQFTFLGTRCIVAATSNADGNNAMAEHVGVTADFKPTMTAMYADKEGVFREQKFYYYHLPALIAENNDTGPIRTLNRTIRDRLIEENKKVGLSMQGGYNDGVDAMFNEINKRLTVKAD